MGRHKNPTPLFTSRLHQVGERLICSKTIKHINHRPHASTRPSSPSQSRRRRMSQHSQVLHAATICTLATPLGFVCLLRDSRDRVSTEKMLVEHNCPLPSILSPHSVTAVRVKHLEGTLVDHRGALSSGMVVHSHAGGREIQATGGLSYIGYHI